MGVARLQEDAPVALAPVLDEIRSRREEFQQLRHIPQDVVDKFKARTEHSDVVWGPGGAHASHYAGDAWWMGCNDKSGNQSSSAKRTIITVQ